MRNYLIAYHKGGQFESQQQGAEQMARWKAWIASLGDVVVNPGTPLGTGKLVSSGGVSDRGADFLTGFSIVRADSLETALAFARRCPYLDYGTLEVAEIMDMK
jgi:hypothetical protein